MARKSRVNLYKMHASTIAVEPPCAIGFRFEKLIVGERNCSGKRRPRLRELGTERHS